MNRIYYLFIFVPISIIFHFLKLGSPSIQFLLIALSIIPLAALLGEGTEELTKHTGPKLGGFIGATFGNLTELIISIFALKAGLLDIVKSSIAGALIGNLLLVLGLSMMCGGIKYKTQTFSKSVNISVSMLTFAAICLIVPAVCTGSLSLSETNKIQHEALSIAVSIVMIVLYICSLYFSFFTHKDLFGVEHELIYPKWSKLKSICVLTITTLVVAFEAELLVGKIEPMTNQLHLSKLFVGLILLPLIGNAAENYTAVSMALKNKMDVAIEITVGASLQIILFVAPVLVFISLLFKPMSLIFNVAEILAITVAVIIVNKVCQDGESNWLEGLQLISVYCILAVTFFLM